MWMPTRTYDPEILDVETPGQRILEECYSFMRASNRLLGGVSATRSWFEKFSRNWIPGETIRILDVATGAADIPRAVAKWGRERGFDIRLTALDLDPGALQFAKKGAQDIGYLCANVLQMPCRDGAFDYVTSSLFFHHLTDEQIVAVLSAFDRIAKRGIVVNDIVRKWRAWFWVSLFTAFSNSILRYDGPMSIRKALRVPEARELVYRAGISYLKVQTHFGHRLTIAGEKRTKGASAGSRLSSTVPQ